MTKANKAAVALFLCWLASYMERFLINMALPFIGDDFNLSESQMGLLLSTFFLGYALMQLPAGWLADRFGSRRIVIFSIAAFTLLSIATGLAWSIAVLFVVRFLFGIFEGCFPPAAVKAVSETYPSKARARVQSLMLSTNPISLVVAPLIAVPLIHHTGWRGMFICASLIGVVALMMQIFWGRYRADQDTVSSKALDDSTPGSAETGINHLSALLKDRVILKISLVNFGVNILIWGFLSWIPTYMLKVMKLDLTSVGFISALPGVAGFVGILLGGWLADRVFFGRERFLLAGSILSACAALVLMLNVTWLPLVVLCQVATAMFVKVAFISLWALPLRLIPPARMGAATGVVNLGSQLAGVVAPAVMGYMITLGSGSYSAAFIFLAACAGFSAAIATTLSEESSKESKMGGLERCGEATKNT